MIVRKLNGLDTGEVAAYSDGGLVLVEWNDGTETWENSENVEEVQS